MTSWLRAEGDDVVLSLHIQPGAKQTEVVGPHGEMLKIRLAAPPVDGKANTALLGFITEKINAGGAVRKKVGAGRTAVALIGGHTSRSKRVRISGVSTDLVMELFLPA